MPEGGDTVLLEVWDSSPGDSSSVTEDAEDKDTGSMMCLPAVWSQGEMGSLKKLQLCFLRGSVKRFGAWRLDGDI
jgi:hypothetical protein